MGTKPVRSIDAISDTSVAGVDMKVEVVVIPVSDVDDAKEFYRRLGWRLDQTPPGVVQFTPHGSRCSVQFGTNDRLQRVGRRVGPHLHLHASAQRHDRH